MEIIVSIKSQYGSRAIIPVCDKAKLFAELAGTRTLTAQAIKTIKFLGYTVSVQQEEVAL